MGRAQDHREASEVRAPTAGRVIRAPTQLTLTLLFTGEVIWGSGSLGGDVEHTLSFPNQGWPGVSQSQNSAHFGVAHFGVAPCCPQAEGPGCRQLVLRSMWEEQQLSLLCLFLLLVHITCDWLCEGHDNLRREKTALCPAILLEPPSSVTTQTVRPPAEPSGLRCMNGCVPHKAGVLTRSEARGSHKRHAVFVTGCWLARILDGQELPTLQEPKEAKSS